MTGTPLKRAAMEHSMIFLPHDILFFILIRLHVKSLLRFRSVSKPWKVIISDEKFKKTHHDQSKASSPQNLLVQLNDGEFEFRDLENSQIAMRIQKFPLKRFQHAPALCSCDGMVLLKSHLAYKAYALWNPYTNEYGIFECPYVEAYSCKTPHACGFSYDSNVDDYKVILIYKLFYTVCSVNRNHWMKKTSDHPKVQALNDWSYECSKGISVDGYVFWSLEWKINHFVGRNSTIIYFDLKLDELKEVPRPDFIGENHLYRLPSLKGRIGLYGGSMNIETLNVWIMEQDGWKLLMKISCNVFCKHFVGNVVLLGCTRSRGGPRI
ncbi:putative F-box protein At3g16210 [Nicotiana tabacum]|uniref:F-box protein At3g16210 n=1 Tax=Nicotiana tabacum TaxID=4097 RepID=A0AC58RNR2_TOBAC